MISHSFLPVTSNLARVVAPTRRPTPTTSIMSKCEHHNYQENTMLFFVCLSYKWNYHNSHNLHITIRSLSDRSSTWKKRRQHSPTLQQESAIPLHFAISNLKFYSRNHENFPYCPVCRRSIFGVVGQAPLRTQQRTRLHIPVGILWIPVFFIPVALFSPESRFLFRRNLFFTPSEIRSVWGLRRMLRRK